MKNIRTWIPVAIIALSLLSCQKEKLDPLPEDELGSCEPCEFVYRKSARLDGLRVEDGNNLVFMYKDYWVSLTNQHPNQAWQNYSGLFFEVPAGADSFHFDKDDMSDGKVAHITMCPNCGYVALKPVDGFVKGKKVSSTRWLVEAKVVLAAEYSGETFDTLAFNRYFKPE